MKKLSKIYNIIVIQSFIRQNKGFDLFKESFHLRFLPEAYGRRNAEKKVL